MTAQIAISKNADFSSSGLPWFGQPIDMDGLFASYFWGSLHPNHPGWDYSLNGRDAVPKGAMTLRDDRFNGGWMNGAVAPAMLGSAFTAALTITPTGTQGSPVAETYLSNAPDGAGGLSMEFAATVTSGVGYFSIILRDEADAPFAAASFPFLPSTGTKPTTLIFVVQPALITLREFGVGVSRAGEASIAGTGVYSDQSFVVGDNSAGTAGGAESQYAAQFFNRALGADECAMLYAQIKAQMASIGVTV